MVAVAQSGGPSGRGHFRLAWRGAEIKAQIDSGIQSAMDETAAAAKAEAQAIVPVDTGRLRDSIEATVEARGIGQRRTLVLSASAPYALYVELGTSRAPAQPYLRPAIDREAPRLTQRLRTALRGGV